LCASSSPGAGSCFRLYLPNQAQSDSALVLPHNAPTAARAPSAPLCVLAVDDETDVREFVRSALEARGHRVHLASDVTSALEQLELMASEPRLVALIDLTLAVSDGREVVLALRARVPGLAVVLMSGQSAQNLADTTLAVGAQGRLAKPFGVVALERALAAALEAAPNAASSAAAPAAALRAPEGSAAV
jgi:DNA-binding NtrC family response regulator